jgi:hypothetical protein
MSAIEPTAALRAAKAVPGIPCDAVSGHFEGIRHAVNRYLRSTRQFSFTTLSMTLEVPELRAPRKRGFFRPGRR